ncbi:hypothetical protein BDR03DRAFT_940209 [Suillus americanus]|nr:hypothetical protein BDR03DRAFT_940209 [Suillus americanus]
MQYDVWLHLGVSEIWLILNNSRPINLFRLVINIRGFSQSVESLFHLSSISFGTGSARAIISAGLFQFLGVPHHL